MAPSIGEVVRELRLARKLSQQQVEYLSKGKVKRNWLAQLEKGHIRHSKPEMIAALAAVYGVSVLSIYEAAGIIPSADDLSLDDQRLLRKFHALTDEQKIAFLDFIEHMYPSSAPQRLPEKKRNAKRVVRS